VASDQYRMHRLRPGDEWVLGTLSRGNARFGEGQDSEWLPPLSTEEASRFVSDPRTICVVAIDQKSNHIAGFVYGGVLQRRHTKLEHVCLYEVGVDIDHRSYGVGTLLLQAFAAEARSMGIDRGFVITAASNAESIALYESYGAVRSPDTDLLFGLNF
jgi:ribosomal protein S18 acetylase RimI-like enzyme